MKQRKRCSSSWKILCFFVRTLKDICVNCKKIHWTKRFCWHMEQLLNWIIRKMDKRECVFTKNTMEMKSSAQWGHWGGGSYKNAYLSSYCMEGKRKYINADNTIATLKFSTSSLNYPYLKWITIDRLDTHPLRSGGANSVLLAGYSDRDI